jgi:hypothetical protein
MAKKSRRARKKSSRKVSRAPVSAQVKRAVVPAAPEAVAEPPADSQEYSYVVADLRQVAILAAAMFVLLIGLSFFIG